DEVAVLSGLLLIWPGFVLIFLLIKLTSPGPVLYAQTRVGLQGRLFRLYKFRSMVPGADELGSSVTVRGDARITPVGRFLRRTKLDELPQLWNVLIGDMSLVGPRPEVPEIVEHYTPAMRRILDVRPGITSVASLHFRDEENILATFDNPDRVYTAALVPFKILLAMAHVDQQSLWFDLKILIMTIYGVSLGRWWPIGERDDVSEFKRNLLIKYKNKESCSETF
ncbi:MAG TPA: sugar transferase, partial [Gemmataceae bacterium]|nr:sugar transferase [Gemmataceae bacterium]